LLYLGRRTRREETRKRETESQRADRQGAERDEKESDGRMEEAREDRFFGFVLYARYYFAGAIINATVRAAKERALNPRAPPPARIRRTSVLFRLRFSGYLRGVWPSQSDRSLGVAGGSSLSSLL